MIALSCKHVFQSSLFYLTSLTPRLDLKPLATLEPLPSWFKQRDKPFGFPKRIVSWFEPGRVGRGKVWKMRVHLHFGFAFRKLCLDHFLTHHTVWHEIALVTACRPVDEAWHVAMLARETFVTRPRHPGASGIICVSRSITACMHLLECAYCTPAGVGGPAAPSACCRKCFT